MAGSLNHLVTEDGTFSFGNVENARDKAEALMECFDLIAVLAKDKATLDAACDHLGFPRVKAMPRAGARAWIK